VNPALAGRGAVNGGAEKRKRIVNFQDAPRLDQDPSSFQNVQDFSYSVRTRSSNLISTPNTPAISSVCDLTGAETVMQRAPVILEV